MCISVPVVCDYICAMLIVSFCRCAVWFSPASVQFCWCRVVLSCSTCLFNGVGESLFDPGSSSTSENIS